MIFARATLDDLPAVVHLAIMVERQHETYWPLRWKLREGLPEGYLRWMTRRIDDPKMFIHVAKDPALAGDPNVAPPPSAVNPTGVIGMILVSINDEIPIYTYTEFAMVQDMAVADTHRRRGIAQQLLKDAAAWAKSHNLSQLRLMVADKNPEARKAFLKAGFKPTYHEMILPLQTP